MKPIGPYSISREAQGFVFVSGQISLEPDIKAATTQILENISSILESHKLTLKDAIKTTVFLTNLDDFAKMNEVYETFFTNPYPARSTIGVCALPKGANIEIECIAARPPFNPLYD